MVFTGGASLVKEFTSKLDLGAEVTGALAKKPELNRGELRFQVGGNYSIKESCTFDFGITGGRFAASPRVGVQLGFSIDF